MAAPLKPVTRDIDLDEARDLLERVPRAALALASPHGALAEPVRLVARDGRYWVGLAPSAGPRPSPGQEVVLLVDEGVHWFDLRAVYIRGRAQPAAAPPGAEAGRDWFEVTPLKTRAWDYGSLREAADGL
jgi:hypothetical protein